MRSTASRWLVPIRVALFAGLCGLVASGAPAAKHPRYGGTLRVELRESAISLDPRTWKPGTLESAASEKLAALVFDRLLSLDNYGHFQPQLAAEWSHDAGAKRWQFRVRDGVKFSDDTPLTAAEAAAALRPLLPTTIQVSSSGNTLVFQSSAPLPDLLEILASGRYFVYRAVADSNLVGTGPFLVAEASPAAAEGKSAHYLLKANENCWAGRPFVDAIDLTVGLPALRRLLDLQVGKADLIEIAPELVRRAAQDNLRVWTSAPVITFGLRVDPEQPATSDARLRQALSYSLDRATVANVLLQKQAQPAAALLPQWLSGYAFLFDMDTNLDRAKELRATLPANLASAASPLRLRIDVPGELPKLLAERVAVNARQAGLSVQVLPRPLPRDSSAVSTSDSAMLHFFAWHAASLSPRWELETLLRSMAVAGDSGPPASIADLYARERRVLDNRYLMPIVALPEYAGLGPNLRNWLPSRWGEWHLADLWLDAPDAAAPSSALDSSVASSPVASGARP